MTVSTRPYFKWGSSGWNSLAGPYQSCSPNLMAVTSYFARTPAYGGRSLGCHNQRSIRGGSSLSTHAYGAAADWLLPDRNATVRANNFLVANSKELGINAIHDYAADSIWYPLRGWHYYSMTGNWLHIETTPEAFNDGRSVESRIAKPVPLPPPVSGPWDPLHRKYGLFPVAANKPILTHGDGYAAGTTAERPYVEYFTWVMIMEAGYAGAPLPYWVYHLQTVAQCQNLQRFFGLPITGTCDAATWKVVDFLATRVR